MSTNTQVKVPMTAMPKVVFANKDQLKKAAKSNPGSLNNLGTWNPGTSARAIIALLKLTSILCKISNDYGDQVMKQIQASTTIAKATGQAQVNAGEAQYNEAFTQGIISAVGGGLSAIATIAVTVNGFNSGEIKGLESEEQGLQTYSERLNNRIEEEGANPTYTEKEPEEQAELEKHLKAIEEKPSDELRKLGETRRQYLKKNPQITKEQISAKNEELVNQEKSLEESQYESDDQAIKQTSVEEATKLKDAVEERLKKVREQKNALIGDSQSKSQAANNVIQGTQQAFSGFGTVASAHFKTQAAEYQKDLTLDQNADSLIYGILNQNRSDADKYFQNATEVNQVINAIRQANQIN